MIKSFSNFLLRMFNKYNNSPTYYGTSNMEFDIETMRYRMFGAVWKIQNNYRYILGYWFSDDRTDLMNQINSQNLKNLLKYDEQITEVYQSIRENQVKELWNRRIKLSKNAFKNEKWKEKKPGWYITKSNNSFPSTITCIQKTKDTLWLEHVYVCETESDLKRFINLINLEHKGQLVLEDIAN